MRVEGGVGEGACARGGVKGGGVKGGGVWGMLLNLKEKYFFPS